MPTAPATPCPCASKQAYAVCCGPCHQGRPASDARALMRSRYSAYTLALEDYLLATWHSTTRPAQLGLRGTAQPEWLGLTIKRYEPIDADHALVEFIARYRQDGRVHRLHESSRFVREEGRWWYVDGKFSQ